MNFVVSALVVSGIYSLGMACISTYKEESYAHLFDQLKVVEQVKNETIASASAQNNPHKAAQIADHFGPNGNDSLRKSEYWNATTMLTVAESQEKLRQLDKELKIIQKISPYDILSNSLIGNSRSWRRNQPIPLSE